MLARLITASNFFNLARGIRRGKSFRKLSRLVLEGRQSEHGIYTQKTKQTGTARQEKPQKKIQAEAAGDSKRQILQVMGMEDSQIQGSYALWPRLLLLWCDAGRWKGVSRRPYCPTKKKARFVFIPLKPSSFMQRLQYG